MDFNAVEASSDGVFGGACVVGCELVDFLDCEASRCARGRSHGCRTAANKVVAFRCEVIRIGSSAKGPELEIDVGAFGVHGVSDVFPTGDLRIVVDARNVRIAGGAWGDEGCFCDEESAWNGGALSVVVCYHGERNVVVVSAVAG